MRLRTNKILLNTDKIELVLLRQKKQKKIKKIKKIKKPPKNKMNFRIYGQKIKMLSKTKYLGLFLHENFSFKYYLSKIWHYVRAPLLRTIYFASLDLHLRYRSQIWGQKENYTVITNDGGME